MLRGCGPGAGVGGWCCGPGSWRCGLGGWRLALRPWELTLLPLFLLLLPLLPLPLARPRFWKPRLMLRLRLGLRSRSARLGLRSRSAGESASRPGVLAWSCGRGMWSSVPDPKKEYALVQSLILSAWPLPPRFLHGLGINTTPLPPQNDRLAAQARAGNTSFCRIPQTVHLRCAPLPEGKYEERIERSAAERHEARAGAPRKTPEKIVELKSVQWRVGPWPLSRDALLPNSLAYASWL